MRHPSHRFIKYLVIKAKATNENVIFDNNMGDYKIDSNYICDELISKRLPMVDELEVHNFFKKLVIPKWFRFYVPKHKKSYEFIKNLDVLEFWESKDDYYEVFGLFKNARLIETLKILLVGKINLMEIGQKLELKFRTVIPISVINQFEKMFWDVDNMDYASWNKILIKSPLSESILATVVGSPDQARYRAGFQPKIEGQAYLREVCRTLFYRLQALRTTPEDRSTAINIVTYTNALVTLHTAIYGGGASLEEILRDFKTIKLKNKDVKRKSLDEITSGQEFTKAEGYKMITAPKI